MKILIIEDEENIALPLKTVLEKENYSVDYASEGQEGLDLALVNSYDCILLDLNLPQIDGVEIATKLRKEDITTPIIMVTARSQMHNKLEGFNHGADDYITKPFNIKELLARIKATIKRNSINQHESLKFGQNLSLELKTGQNCVHKNGQSTTQKINLSTKETSILEYLLRNKGRIVSSEELLEHVWDREVNLFSDTVKTHIKTLRQKVDPDKKNIKTVRGKGYVIN